jgi:serine/threonine protein phosphatase PrpC
MELCREHLETQTQKSYSPPHFSHSQSESPDAKVDSLSVVQAAYKKITALGSSTVLVGCLTTGTSLSMANLGDSGFQLYR